MKYMAIFEGDLDALNKLVNQMIGQGWRPQGGVGSYQVEERDNYGNRWLSPWFMQAMVSFKKQTGV